MRLKIGIIGAGLGGLLAGAFLAKKGNEVTIFEKLPRIGGRFTNVTLKGFQLSTGALHMIPHYNGTLPRMLRELNAGVTFIKCSPPGLFRINKKDYTYDKLPELFGAWNKIKLLKLMNDLLKSQGGSESYEEWISKRIMHKKVFDLANAFCRWSLSLDANEVSSSEICAITQNVEKFGGPAVPKGGCKAISEELARIIMQNNGKIFLKTEVKRIVVENSIAKGIETEENYHDFDVIINNAGPKETVKLCGEKNFDKAYIKKIKSIKEATGIKINFAAKKAMLKTSAVIFTPDAQVIGGINEVTNADKSLAPGSMHLIMTHQKIYSQNKAKIREEIEKGIEDVRENIPEFDKYCELLTVQIYRENNPVNRSVQGSYISFLTPIKNLYNVGDAIKPRGYMETEGVAKGVELMLKNLEMRTKAGAKNEN